MWAASLKWPLALRMARRVSTLVDLMAGSDESLSPLRLSRRLESAVFDPRRTAGLDLLGTDPSTLETMKLPVAVGRSESPWLLVTERSSTVLEGPSWMAGKQTGGPSRGPRAPTWRPWTRPWGPDIFFWSTWGTILNGGKANRRPLPWSQGTMNLALGSGYGNATWWVVCWRKSQTSQPVVRPTGQTRVIDARRPSSTPCSVSGRLWTGNLPGCCGLLADGREPMLSPWDRTTWTGVSSSALMCTIVCLPRSWCKPQPLRCRTSREPPGDLRWGRKSLTVDDGLHLQNDLWDADHCPCVEREPNWAPQP